MIQKTFRFHFSSQQVAPKVISHHFHPMRKIAHRRMKLTMSLLPVVHSSRQKRMTVITITMRSSLIFISFPLYWYFLKIDLAIKSKYLQGVPTFNIELDPSTSKVSRKFLSSKYGGGDRGFAVYMTKVGSKAYSAIFPMDDYNPLMPSKPGVPGLLYTGRTDLAERTHSRVFRPVRGSSNPALWEYLGDYKISNVGNLTSAEFQKQAMKVIVLRPCLPDCSL